MGADHAGRRAEVGARALSTDEPAAPRRVVRVLPDRPGINKLFDYTVPGDLGARAGVGIHARTAQFGYWLGETFWGRGIVTAAGRAFLEHLKNDGRFVRLEAPVFEWNPSSMRVLEKLGFERVAVLRRNVTKDGQLIDSVLYSYLL